MIWLNRSTLPDLYDPSTIGRKGTAMRTRSRILIPLAAIVLVVGFAGKTAAQSSGSVTEYVEAWMNSAHADATAEAFTHWNSEGEIPANCARCHSGIGFRAYYGVDGSEPGTIAHPIPVGGFVDCGPCHNNLSGSIQSVMFPSGAAVTDVGSSAACLTCHQGRLSTPGLNDAVAGTDEDTVNPNLRFVNPHYAAAGATLFGTLVKGAYEYAGESYSGRFAHVPDFAQCTACHDPHALEVRTSECVACHGTDAPMTIRTTKTDFDGDGDTTEGIAAEIDSMHAILGDAIGAYASEVAGTAIVYAEGQYPYFFVDSNANGMADPDEAVRPNAYGSWTPRLVKAAYNYQFVGKDNGAYAHNPHYALQVLYDSIGSLASVVEITSPEMARP